jgi:hypothetical protein
MTVESSCTSMNDCTHISIFFEIRRKGSAAVLSMDTSTLLSKRYRRITQDFTPNVLGLGSVPRVRDKGEPGMENIVTTRAVDRYYSKLQALQ